MSLPALLLLPQIRRAARDKICVQLVTSYHAKVSIDLEAVPAHTTASTFCLGERCYLHLLVLEPQQGEFPVDTLIAYQLYLDNKLQDLSKLGYEGAPPQFVVPHELQHILHGSCRNPHHASHDSLKTADLHLAQSRAQGEAGSQLLLMSGDQIYADDVAGPMLLAVHQLIDKLGLYPDLDSGLTLPDKLEVQLYQRHLLLPKTPWQQRSKLAMGYWLKKDEPHFTSMKSGNHLISLNEFVALYLLSWSACAWQLIDYDAIQYQSTDKKRQQQFAYEWQHLQGYVATLSHAERLCANVSTLMMFDDHDVTDDWNLTAKWEAAVRQDNESRRIVNNGLVAYWLFQGMGNDALEYTGSLQADFVEAIETKAFRWSHFDKALNRFNHWHYCLNTQPKIVVLDTRTHRWRNEQNFNEPSGLMDWDRLLDLEENLISHQQVIIVSPAPVFGVKAIEAIQAVFNACGEPLLVDVENWMAHEGAAKKLLDIFRRPDTPVETIILSGDVHYSFCFSVKARFGKHDNRIWQLTASGIKNEFPKPLIGFLDKLDSWLYAPLSPLNFFTKRWKMSVDKHKLMGSKNTYLVSDSAISLIKLRDGLLEQYQLLHGNGNITQFDLED